MTIPQQLRQRYGIRPGQDVVFEEREGGLFLRRRLPEGPLRALMGHVQADIDVDQYLEDARGSGPSGEA